MTTIRKSILIALAVVGMGATSLSAQAHEAGAGQQAAQQGAEHGGKYAGQKMDREQRRAAWAARAAARQQKLHDALTLTAAQEGAWANYQAAIKPQPRAQRMDRAQRMAMPAPQRMEQRLAMAKQRLAAMEARVAATASFYAVLTPEQKKVFDSAAGQGRHAGHGKHRMMRG